MLLFPAIDLYDGAAVRLIMGDFKKMTVYNRNPVDAALGFKNSGATCLHIVDLFGAKTGVPSCTDIIERIVLETGMFVQTGGGIRDMKAVEALIKLGVSRIIIGTAAVMDRSFLCDCIKSFGSKIAVGADIRDGRIAVKGWSKVSDIPVDTFFEDMEALAVKTVICTDISKDGMMTGTNIELYRRLSDKYSFDIIASGGVSSYENITALFEMGVFGAILGKALYENAISLEKALKAARGESIDN